MIEFHDSVIRLTKQLILVDPLDGHIKKVRVEEQSAFLQKDLDTLF